MASACDKVPLLAPTGSTITLTVSTTTLGSNGTAEVIATVSEQAGTPAHNGTLVTFTTTLGVFDPREATTQNGKAVSTFRANGQSGVATIGAVSGGAKPATTEAVKITIGAAAADSVTLRAEPTANVPVTGGTITIIASARDISGNALADAPVTFSTDAGQLSAPSGVTDANGEARTSLTTNRETIVKARVGAKEGTLTIRATNLPTASIAVTPASPIVGVPVTITVTPGSTTGGSAIQNVIIDLGDGTVRVLGAISSATPVSHIYQRADTYTITVTVIDITGQRTSNSTSVTVQRATVGASLTAPPSGQVGGPPLSFTASITNPSNLPITSGIITFGDGTSASLNTTGSTTVQKAYNVSGDFTVIATYRDQQGTPYSASAQVNISPPAAFEVTLDAQSAEAASPMTCVPATGYPKRCNILFIGGGVAVKFTANATPGFGATITSYRWAYGDGSGETTTAREVDHVFRSRGEFVTVVTVFASNGATGTQRITILVE